MYQNNNKKYRTEIRNSEKSGMNLKCMEKQKRNKKRTREVLFLFPNQEIISFEFMLFPLFRLLSILCKRAKFWFLRLLCILRSGCWSSRYDWNVCGSDLHCFRNERTYRKYHILPFLNTSLGTITEPKRLATKFILTEL